MLRLYDTLTAQKRPFEPSGPEVRIYVCGVTTYAPAHIGHAMSYVYFDVLRRYLEFKGYRVKHVQNFTDIDDKVIARARTEGVHPLELSERYIAHYFEDMDALNIARAHHYPRASQEVPYMVEMVRVLVEKGYAYEAGGDVYFRVQRWPGYGRLSHRHLEDMLAGARVEPGERKEHPLDFVLWKSAKPGEPAWDSPWGRGRPGWHIECSAMSLRYLGMPLDIHGGGQDLVFPHHENEIAQSEAYAGTGPFSRFWVHNGLLRLGEEKMSKSLGNLVTVQEALARHSADALRLFFLTSHYRSPLAYTEEAVNAQERAAERLRNALRPHDSASPNAQPLDPSPFLRRFTDAMDDDLNTPQALAALFDLAREINRAREEGRDTGQARQTLAQLAGVLGLTLREEGVSTSARPFIELLVEVRGELRRLRHYALADTIRARLAELGVALEDTPQGTRWRFRRQ